MIKIYYSSIYFMGIAHGLGWILDRVNKTRDLSNQIIWEVTNCIDTNINIGTNDIWIILGLQNIKGKMPNKYIIWNFEQFEVDGPEFDSKFWSRMGKAQMVLDYSHENIQWLALNKNIKGTFMGLGWMPQMKINAQTINWTDKKILFSFVGLMNERRRDIIKPCYQLAKEDNSLMYLSNKCWGKEYDEIYSDTKIGLNIHYYTGKTILEVHRIIPLILNGIWVISEKSGDTFYNELFNDLVTWSDQDKFAECIDMIKKMDQEQVQKELVDRKRKLIQTCDAYTYFIKSGVLEYLSE